MNLQLHPLKKKPISNLVTLKHLTIDELKKVLEICGLITINNNIVKFVRSPSSYRGKYSWSMFF